jgi:ribosome maturation factor RimP
LQANKAHLEQRVTTSLAAAFPDVELVDLEIGGGRAATLRLYIDRPRGVDLQLCADVTAALDDLRDEYTLEVSSPGLDRPLRKPEHFVAARGRRVHVRTSDPIRGRSNFRGVLAAADQDHLVVTLDDGSEARIALPAVSRAHVIFTFDDNGGHRE